METRKNIMISLPMANRTDEEIAEKMEKIEAKLAKYFKETEGCAIRIMPSYQPEAFDKEQRRDKIKNIPAFFLGKSISVMAESDVVFFAKGWGRARGCRTEYEVAYEYNIPMLFEHNIEEVNTYEQN